MLHAILLIPALRIVFSSGIEFTPSAFAELTPAQLDAYRRKVEEPKGKVYQVVAMEPTAIDKQDEEGTMLELNVVSEQERQNLLDAVAFIYTASRELTGETVSFEDRLNYLRTRLPPEVTGDQS